MGSARILFHGTAEFEAMHAAEAFAAECGFSVASWERNKPTGLMFGDYQISKWRNMSPPERAALHGQIDSADKRHGSATVTIFGHAPAEAWARYTNIVHKRGRVVTGEGSLSLSDNAKPTKETEE